MYSVQGLAGGMTQTCPHAAQRRVAGIVQRERLTRRSALALQRQCASHLHRLARPLFLFSGPVIHELLLVDLRKLSKKKIFLSLLPKEKFFPTNSLLSNI